MANINPAARGRDSVFLDGLAADPAAGRRIRRQRLRLNTYRFTDIDDDDDILVGQRGVIAVAWQPNGVADICAVGVQTTSTLTSIRMQTPATDPDGWIHVLSGGSQQFTETADETPIGRTNNVSSTNTLGYVRQGTLYVNHKSATPDILTQARVASVHNLRLTFFPFTTAINTGDIWKCTTGTRGGATPDTLCSGIVAIAWQAATIADNTDVCAPTLNANGDVLFTCTGSTPVGYLWVWRRA